MSVEGGGDEILKWLNPIQWLNCDSSTSISDSMLYASLVNSSQ